MKYSREPISPPTSAAKAISYAQSAGLSSSLKRLAASAPMAMNASAKANPNVFSVTGPMSRFGCTPERLVLACAEGLVGIQVGAKRHDPAVAHPEAIAPHVIEREPARGSAARANERHQPVRRLADVLEHELGARTE